MTGAPLAGIRVLDLTTVIMGPWATYLLAGYGADVIKIEPPEGDIMRYAGPSRHRGMGPLFMFMNRGKRSVVLDLKQTASRDALLRLCETADVLISNVRPAAMQRLGLGYDDVRARNDRLIYTTLVGYAQDGPYAAKPAYDDLIQGISGLAGTFERVGGDPRFVPVLVADRITGMNAVHAIIAALFARERGAGGQHIEIPMFETMAELVLSDHLGGHLFEPPAGDFGYNRALAPNRRPFRTRDGYVCVLLYTEKQWRTFFAVVDQVERYEADAKLSDADTRRLDYDYAYGVVAAIMAGRTSADWLAALDAADIPVSPVSDVADLLIDEQLVRGTFWAHDVHPTEGAIRNVRRPARMSISGTPDLRPAPELGEHTAEVLRTVGLVEQSPAERPGTK